MTENQIGDIVVDAAIRLHRELGPGLMESVYEAILAKQFMLGGLTVIRQVAIPITFQGETYDEGFRADLILNNKVILELKSVERLTRAHHKQLLTYLRFTQMKLGYLLNFGEELMKTGISRVINGSLSS